MDKYVLVENLSTIKTAICETFQNTQRIKLISFEVSNHYIILGTSSGGIYIFKRNPCEFLRIIPSKEGPTIQIKVCPNEKNLAIATAKGLVIILENYFVDFNIRPFLFSEHEKCLVTEMIWHGNDLYCGDDAGKISVCSVLSTLTQAIFQSPSSTLMHLDSSITQIDAYKKYLLISTKTRSYLCDTEKEQFKQIGKKLRDGNYGSCFSQEDESYYLHKNQGARKEFKTLEEMENFDNIINDDVKIYCSRPGARIWAADFEASVLTTYQFRNSLNQPSTSLVLVDDVDKDARLKFSNRDSIEISKDFNFNKIYPVYPNIMFTCDKKGIYFFNLDTSALLCWSHNFENIKDVKILKPYIYIWRNDLQIDIVSLYSLEDLIISTLLNKQYFLTADICGYFNDDVLNLVGKSKKINLISILETKFKEIGSDELLPENIKIILDKLKEYYNKEQTLGIKLENGIVVVDNQYSINNLAQNPVLPDISVPPQEEKSESLEILYRQYVLNKINKSAELTDSSKLLNSLNINELPSLFDSFIKYVNDKYEEDAAVWCKQQTVKLASKQYKNFDTLDKLTLNTVISAFLYLNNFEKDSCKCQFPLPIAHTKKLEHFGLACSLYEFSDDKNKSDFLKAIPILYKHKISNLKDKTSNLSLIVQFSDKEVFKECLKDFTYDIWEEILKLFIKLHQENCLKCNEKIPVKGVLTWTEIGALMVESMGAKNATRLLRRYVQFISSEKLDLDFFQTCIFSLTCENRSLGNRFVERTRIAGNSKKFGEYLEQFLQNKYLSRQPLSHQRKSNNTSICAYCQLSVDNPVLVDVKKCHCGLTFHKICCSNNNNICKFCVDISN